MALRDYQQDIYDSVKKSMVLGNKNILAVSPAGSGKSVVMASIAKSATEKGNRVLFFVHRIEIVKQVRETFINVGVDMNLCHIGMVQTITRRLDSTEEPSMILVDECHRSLAKTYKAVFDRFPSAYVIGFTATPTLLSGRGLGEVYEDMIVGKSVEWLIENKRLAPFKYYSVDLMDNTKLKHNSTGDFSHQSITDAIGNVLYGDVIKTYKRLADHKRTIVYCHSVESSKSVAKEFSDSGYKVAQVDGTTHKDEREKSMADFRAGKITLLINAELYGEGVDVPDCEVVILLRPTESLSLFIQQSMRPMRYVPGKEAIIIDHVANYTRHGLPDTPREWSLEARNKKGKGGTVESSGYKQCPDCFTVIKSALPVCDVCGHVFAEENEMKVQEAELVEIKQEFKLETDYAATKPLSEIQTMAELKAYQKAKGYKPGWVYFQAKLKKLIK